MSISSFGGGLRFITIIKWEVLESITLMYKIIALTVTYSVK